MENNKEEYLKLLNDIADKASKEKDMPYMIMGAEAKKLFDKALQDKIDELGIEIKEEPNIVVPEVNSNTNLEDFKKETLINNGFTPFNRRTRRLIEKNKKKHAKKLLAKHKDGLKVISKMIDEVGEEETTKYLIERLKEIKDGRTKENN